MSRFLEAGAAAALALLVASSSASAQDVAAGEKYFARCKACHAVGPDAKNKVGPQLNDIVGRTAATAEDYKYSPAMTKAGEDGLVWTEETLASFLANPRGFIKGTKMAFAGAKKAEDITNVIAYLHTASMPADAAAKPDAVPIKDSSADAVQKPASAPGVGAVFKLGRVATDDEVAAWDIDVRPDGSGLPQGKGTVAQGEQVYEENCASCHGDFGEAIGRWPILAGGQETLASDRPTKTIGSYWPYLSTVYDYVRRAMPFGNARSLSDDEVYALTAYILYLNDIVTDETFELSDANFASVKLPNEENFIEDNRFAEPHYAQAGEPCMSDCLPGKATISMHAAVLDVTPESTSSDEAPAAGIE